MYHVFHLFKKKVERKNDLIILENLVLQTKFFLCFLFIIFKYFSLSCIEELLSSVLT